VKSGAAKTGPTMITEPVPASRFATYVTAVGVVGIFCYGVSIICGFVASGGVQAGPSVRWMTEWGAQLDVSSADTMVTYASAAVLFAGLSIGGQALVPGEASRVRVRRFFGTCGFIVAVAALSLLVLAAVHAVAVPSRLAVLVVLVPLAAVTWLLGLETSRFVVPDFSVQRESAVAQLILAREGLGRLPSHTRGDFRAGAAFALCGLAAGLAVALALPPSTLLFAVVTLCWSSLTTALGLAGFAFMTTSTLTSGSRRNRAGLRVGAAVFYAFLILLAHAPLLAITGSVPVLLVLLVMMMAPIGFGWRPRSAPAWLLDFTLAGAKARLARAELGRTLKASRRRLEVLDAHQGTGRTLTWRGRLRQAAIALLSD